MFGVGKPIFLLDLCSGRGGDIFKWDNAGIDRVMGVDNHGDSISESIKRYKKVCKKVKTRISFFHKDVLDIKLDLLLNQKKVQIIACQFALHYFDLETLIPEISKSLVEGGYFIGVVPDGDVIDKLLDDNTVINNVELERSGPSSYYITLKNDCDDKKKTKQYFEFRKESLKEYMVRKEDLLKICNKNDLYMDIIPWGVPESSFKNLKSEWGGNHISGLYFSFVFQKKKSLNE